ncbi:MAG: hypothetical protein GY758_14180 [Fuerstiella sp.]|nr:hypothetical protein [Fuerstiella sp.]MCP4788051.1 hypothetical protein [Fuerstiella sp.]MCP4855342.1 hypothetical protein [Fuerstiella sp.]
MIRVHLAAQPTGEQGIQNLADWELPAAATDPFARTIEYRTDSGKSDGMQSYGGAGPVIRLPVADIIPQETDIKQVTLQGLRVFGSRYGSGFDPDTTKFHVSILAANANAVWQQDAPYSHFGYRKKWIDIVFDKPLAVAEWLDDKQILTVGIDPEAQQRKGIYFHYSNSTEDVDRPVAKGFVPDKRFFEVEGRQWMIRAYFATGNDATP